MVYNPKDSKFFQENKTTQHLKTEHTRRRSVPNIMHKIIGSVGDAVKDKLSDGDQKATSKDDQHISKKSPSKDYSYISKKFGSKDDQNIFRNSPQSLGRRERRDPSSTLNKSIIKDNPTTSALTKSTKKDNSSNPSLSSTSSLTKSTLNDKLVSNPNPEFELSPSNLDKKNNQMIIDSEHQKEKEVLKDENKIDSDFSNLNIQDKKTSEPEVTTGESVIITISDPSEDNSLTKDNTEDKKNVDIDIDRPSYQKYRYSYSSQPKHFIKGTNNEYPTGFKLPLVDYLNHGVNQNQSFISNPYENNRAKLHQDFNQDFRPYNQYNSNQNYHGDRFFEYRANNTQRNYYNNENYFDFDNYPKNEEYQLGPDHHFVNYPNERFSNQNRFNNQSSFSNRTNVYNNSDFGRQYNPTFGTYKDTQFPLRNYNESDNFLRNDYSVKGSQYGYDGKFNNKYYQGFQRDNQLFGTYGHGYNQQYDDFYGNSNSQFKDYNERNYTKQPFKRSHFNNPDNSRREYTNMYDHGLYKYN